MGPKAFLKRVWAKLAGRAPAAPPEAFDPAWAEWYAGGGQRSCLDVVSALAGELYLHGWVTLPPGAGSATVRGWWNDAELPITRFVRPDVDQAYSWAVAAGWTVAGVRVRAPPPPPAEWNRIRFEAGGKAVGCEWWYSTADEGLPLPDDSRRVRVHGSADAASFRVTGATAIGQLKAGYEGVTGERWDAIGELLDWGCGSGRTTRFLRGSPVKVTGVDVDADNVRWCQANLPFGTFEPIPLLPPTPLPADRFDAAMGVSIFTHLSEPVQRAWLGELARVVRPGGHVLVTKHGPGAMAYLRVTPAERAALAKTGVADRPDPALAGHIDDASYYRCTFHTDEYVRRVWGERFEVRAILTAHVGLQDLVVLRKR